MPAPADVVLHDRLPFAPWALPQTRRLPGVQPLDPADWLRVDEAYAGQMALRDRLIATDPRAVHAVLPEAEAAAAEAAGLVRAHLPGLGFAPVAGGLRRPDGQVVPDGGPPLLHLGRLIQEDVCLMLPDGQGQHRLAGAVLCFPAGWRLDEKLGRPLVRLHAPVAKYTAEVALRVQRLMDAVRPGAPLWRQNAHRSRAALHNPLSEAEAQAGAAPGPLPWVRSEYQCLLRLPRTGAIAFTIHTYLVPLDRLTAEQAAALASHPIHGAA